MQLDHYYHCANQQLSFSRQQASDFAKQIADDFNPLHDVTAKRFCVPGDLLFAVALKHYGLSQHMEFEFAGMVSESTHLLLAEPGDTLTLKDTNNKVYLNISRRGNIIDDPTVISKLTQGYVTFSGHTFPHVLVPLMADQGVMINPARPMVMYERMVIDLDRNDFQKPVLRANPQDTRLDINGKRGKVRLAFDVMDGDVCKGRGEKHMLVSGLLPYVENTVADLVSNYRIWKEKYAASTR